MKKKKESLKKAKIKSINYNDISSDPRYNTDNQPESEKTLEEILDLVYEADERLIESENKSDEDN